jgi:ABC-type transport system involved in multi-copper enzyme maturation permease subunit
LTNPSSQFGRIRVIAAFTWLEAVRTRLPWVVVGMALVLFAASLFVRSLALTESTRIQLGFLSATLRFATVFVVCLHVLGSMLREAQDRGTELLLSIDITRFEYLAGKVVGYTVVAAGISLLFALPVMVIASLPASLAWLASLVLEAWIIVAAALFCVITFNQLMLAASFVLAFYLLSRAMASVVLVSSASILADDTTAHAVLSWGVKALALLLPGLHDFTRTEWLVGDPAGWTTLGRLAVEALVYSLLLFAAALFDLYRKNH